MADDWGLLEPLGSAATATTGDDAMLAALVEVERALLRAWARVGDGDAAAIADALDEETLDRAALVAGTHAGGVPVIPLVEQLRAQAEAAVAGSGPRVHAGATSQDILDSALVLVCLTALVEARDDLVAAGSALAALAESERETVSIARTLGQHAAPSTIGVTVAGWLDGVSSAVEAIDATEFPVQLGGAVGTGEAFDRIADRPDATGDLRAALAAELGLADLRRSWHTERTPILRIAATAALVTAALGRIGRDIAFLARTEIGEVVLGSTGGSSAMPHKRNPVDAVLLTANALRAPGLLSTVHAASVSQDARPAGEWHAEWQALRGLARLALESAEAASGLVATLDVDRTAVARNRALSPELERDAEPTLAASARIVAAATERFSAVALLEAP
ncbi:3-carboxy-cis,cis-muconate cycloisomerase [Agromyces tardus]|uniref:3-carboxy-cis,cis-muconate cycloisomerase n=1 Tax=Agromyces tardus TaxID=2583849 RepID=A0A3M8AHH7_9MICO|nr:lyase family protein [Agromyces tardus]RNB50658.1 3-carboxy-cis,cis-muconate cycloisomerase [Agromyces tardus]